MGAFLLCFTFTLGVDEPPSILFGGWTLPPPQIFKTIHIFHSIWRSWRIPNERFPLPDIRRMTSFFLFFLMALYRTWPPSWFKSRNKNLDGTTKDLFFFPEKNTQNVEKQPPRWNMWGKVPYQKTTNPLQNNNFENQTVNPKCRCFSASNLAALLFKPSKPTQVEEFR